MARTPYPARALLIGAVITVATGYWGFYVYNIALAGSWTGTSLMRGPLFVLLCLVLVNLALRALRPRLQLDQRELLIIYVMATMGAAVSGVGLLAFLVPTIASIQYYEKAFGFDRFMPYVPWHLVVTDPEAIAGFHAGHATIWSLRVIKAWAGPALWWSSFIFAFIFAVLCIQVLVRKQWLDAERLAFPLAYVPLAITERGGAALKGNRLFWFGFGAVALLESANAMNFYYPALPHITLRQTELTQLQNVWPWSQMGSLHVSYNPFLIAIAYFVNLDVSLSIWLFYLLYKVAEWACVAYGMREGVIGGGLARYPLMDEQGVGAFIGLAVMVAWIGRRRLREVARTAWRGWGADDEEMLSYRSALLGALLAGGFMVWFVVRMGLALQLAIPVLTIMFIYSVMLSRVVAESGYAYFTPENGAGETVLFALGSRNVPIRDQVGLGYLSAIDQFYSDSPSPQQLNAVKLGELSAAPPRHMLAAIVVGAVVALASGWWAQLAIYYRYGAASAQIREWWPRMGYQGFRFMIGYHERASGPDWMMLQGVGFGVLFVMLLAKLRAAFYWFPLHPAGYLITGTPAARFIWMPFMLGWLTKLAVVRFGGLRLYRRWMPFFLGVVVGDTFVPALFATYGAIMNQPTYQFF